MGRLIVENIQIKIKKLIDDFYMKSSTLAYANLNENKKYSGWVSDFHLKTKSGEKINLNLNNEYELFLLFVLAIAWSRSGRWENAPYLISHIKHECIIDINYWKNSENIENEIKNRKYNAKNITNNVSGINPRIKISFRKDIFNSIKILANKWDEIFKKLKESNNVVEYKAFIEYLSKIKGLGCGNNTIFIKIPLILRELRCQNIFPNIPGELCCVIDKRVDNACKIIGLETPSAYNSIKPWIFYSKLVYKHFNDLYDIPLFAYKDIYDI